MFAFVAFLLQDSSEVLEHVLRLWTILHGGHGDGEAHLDRSRGAGTFLSGVELVRGLGVVEGGWAGHGFGAGVLAELAGASAGVALVLGVLEHGLCLGFMCRSRRVQALLRFADKLGLQGYWIPLAAR